MKTKPRNHVVLALLKSRRKSGSHEKSKKSIRRKENVKLSQGKYEKS
jgi:hypothetical protein